MCYIKYNVFIRDGARKITALQYSQPDNLHGYTSLHTNCSSSSDGTSGGFIDPVHYHSGQ